MEFQRRLRYIVIFVSLIIFCYQVKIALDNLISNDAVDSTENIPISDLDSPPVITFCPRQGVDDRKLKEWGHWYHIRNLLKGN